MSMIRRASTVLVAGVVLAGMAAPATAQKEGVALVPEDLVAAFQSALDASMEFKQARLNVLTNTLRLIGEINQSWPKATKEERRLIVEAFRPAGDDDIASILPDATTFPIARILPGSTTFPIASLLPDTTTFPLQQDGNESAFLEKEDWIAALEKEIQGLQEMPEEPAISFEPFISDTACCSSAATASNPSGINNWDEQRPSNER